MGQRQNSYGSSGDRCPEVSYAGTPISLDGLTYYWRIRFWDNGNAQGGWSETQSFTMKQVKQVKNVAVIFAFFRGAPEHVKPIHTKTSTPTLSEFQQGIAEDIKRYYLSENASMGAISFDLLFHDNHGEWYKLERGLEYYMDNPFEFIQDAINIADEDIDFSDVHVVIAVSPGGSVPHERVSRPFYRGPALPPFLSFHTKEKGIGGIYVPEWFWAGMWAHELGHSLGMSDLYPKKWLEHIIFSDGDVGDWDLMGTGYNPHPLSSFSRLKAGWLRENYIPPILLGSREVEITELVELNYGDSVPIYLNVSIFPPKVFPVVSYIFEARSKYVLPLYQDSEVDGIAIYKNEFLKLIPPDIRHLDFLEPQVESRWPNMHMPTISSNVPSYIDALEFLKFTYVESLEGSYRPKVRIERPWQELANLVGVSLRQNVADFLTSVGFSPAQLEDENLPDLDLHAYSEDNKHVGMNYQTGEYEIQIPGAITSGDQTFAPEWIFVPSNISVRFVVSSRDVGEFLKANPDIPAENAIMKFSIQYITYGANPRVSMVEENLVVMDREVSDPIEYEIGPGEEMILPKPPEKPVNWLLIGGIIAVLIIIVVAAARKR